MRWDRLRERVRRWDETLRCDCWRPQSCDLKLSRLQHEDPLQPLVKGVSFSLSLFLLHTIARESWNSVRRTLRSMRSAEVTARRAADRL